VLRVQSRFPAPRTNWRIYRAAQRGRWTELSMCFDWEPQRWCSRDQRVVDLKRCAQAFRLAYRCRGRHCRGCRQHGSSPLRV